MSNTLNPDAGELDQRILVERRTSARDELGQGVDTWARLAERWAKVEELSGGENLSADQPTADRMLLVTMRFFDGLTPLDRIIYRDRTLEIVSVSDPDGRRRMTLVGCKEAV